jgi:hypothetical protein
MIFEPDSHNAQEAGAPKSNPGDTPGLRGGHFLRSKGTGRAKGVLNGATYISPEVILDVMPVHDFVAIIRTNVWGRSGQPEENPALAGSMCTKITGHKNVWTLSEVPSAFPSLQPSSSRHSR